MAASQNKTKTSGELHASWKTLLGSLDPRKNIKTVIKTM